MNVAINSNTLGFRLKHGYQGEAKVIRETIFGDVDETETLPIDLARDVLKECREALATAKTSNDPR